jgi:hypothetical protein
MKFSKSWKIYLSLWLFSVVAQIVVLHLWPEFYDKWHFDACMVGLQAGCIVELWNDFRHDKRARVRFRTLRRRIFG